MNQLEVIKIAAQVGSDYYGFQITCDDIISDCRKKEFVSCRHIAMKVIRDTYQMPVVDVARLFNRHHSTVVTRCQTVVDMLVTENEEYSFLYHKVVDLTEKMEAKVKTATITFPKYSDHNNLIKKIRDNYGISVIIHDINLIA